MAQNDNDIQFVMDKLENIEKVFGIGGVISVIIAILIVIFTFKFLQKKTEKFVENISEKSLREFQSKLDKELVKFQTKHQKQVDAVHEIYQKFQTMTSTVNYILHGENFTQRLSAEEEIQHLIGFRHDFKHLFNQNRLLFPPEVCTKIDAIFPSVDTFIDTFSAGLFPKQPPEHQQMNAEENGGLIITGIWKAETFDSILEELNSISNDIENEFRKIYGTEI
jgi:hypothetical protein